MVTEMNEEQISASFTNRNNITAKLLYVLWENYLENKLNFFLFSNS